MMGMESRQMVFPWKIEHILQNGLYYLFSLI